MSGNLQLLAGTLARAKQENRAALIAGMTAGFPTVNEGIAAIQSMLNGGAWSCLTGTVAELTAELSLATHRHTVRGVRVQYPGAGTSV